MPRPSALPRVGGAPNAVIRIATVDDIPVLVELRASMLDALHEPDEYEDGWREAFADWLRQRVPASNYANFIAEVDGQVLAGAQGELIEGQPGPRISRRRVFITNVSTLPGARGQGLATRCFEALLDWARAQGATSAMLNAAPMGEQIYLRAGFKPHDNPEYRRLL